MMLIYPIFRWTPPEFTLQEQIELGEDIARVGRKAFVTAFKQRLSTWSPGSKPKPFTFADILDDAQTKQQQPPTTPKEWITGLSLISLFLGGFAFIIPYQGLLAAMVFVLPVSLGSLLWTHNKVDRWVQSLIDEYTQSVAKSSAEVRADTPSRNHASRGEFLHVGERARVGDPTDWIGVRRLAVQRVWG